MGQWLEQLKQTRKNTLKTTVTEVTDKAIDTFVTAPQGRLSNFRLITSMNDLTDIEGEIVIWLVERSLIYPYQLAAHLKVSISQLEQLLGNLEKNRFIIRSNGMIAINVYGKQKLGLIGS